jgi:hypothetical protein
LRCFDGRNDVFGDLLHRTIAIDSGYQTLFSVVPHHRRGLEIVEIQSFGNSPWGIVSSLSQPTSTNVTHIIDIRRVGHDVEDPSATRANTPASESFDQHGPWYVDRYHGRNGVAAFCQRPVERFRLLVGSWEAVVESTLYLGAFGLFPGQLVESLFDEGDSEVVRDQLSTVIDRFDLVA